MKKINISDNKKEKEVKEVKDKMSTHDRFKLYNFFYFMGKTIMDERNNVKK